MSALAKRMEAHIEELAHAHDVTIVWGKGSGAWADRPGRKVKIPAVRGRSTYYTALHEIGHIVIMPEPKLRLEQESAAWWWALDNADFVPTQGVWKMIHRCLVSYCCRAIQRQKMELPAHSHNYWELLEHSEYEALGVNTSQGCAPYWQILKEASRREHRRAA